MVVVVVVLESLAPQGVVELNVEPTVFLSVHRMWLCVLILRGLQMLFFQGNFFCDFLPGNIYF